jgi:hypothetical protein
MTTSEIPTPPNAQPEPVAAEPAIAEPAPATPFPDPPPLSPAPAPLPPQATYTPSDAFDPEPEPYPYDSDRHVPPDQAQTYHDSAHYPRASRGRKALCIAAVIALIAFAVAARLQSGPLSAWGFLSSRFAAPRTPSFWWTGSWDPATPRAETPRLQLQAADPEGQTLRGYLVLDSIEGYPISHAITGAHIMYGSIVFAVRPRRTGRDGLTLPTTESYDLRLRDAGVCDLYRLDKPSRTHIACLVSRSAAGGERQ